MRIHTENLFWKCAIFFNKVEFLIKTNITVRFLIKFCVWIVLYFIISQFNTNKFIRSWSYKISNRSKWVNAKPNWVRCTKYMLSLRCRTKLRIDIAVYLFLFPDFSAKTFCLIKSVCVSNTNNNNQFRNKYNSNLAS